jgi:hypothetical protein
MKKWRTSPVSGRDLPPQGERLLSINPGYAGYAVLVTTHSQGYQQVLKTSE